MLSIIEVSDVSRYDLTLKSRIIYELLGFPKNKIFRLLPRALVGMGAVGAIAPTGPNAGQ